MSGVVTELILKSLHRPLGFPLTFNLHLIQACKFQVKKTSFDILTFSSRPSERHKTGIFKWQYNFADSN